MSAEQREREAVKEAQLSKEEKRKILEEEKAEEKREAEWKNQFMQNVMTTGRPHLKGFGDKSWQMAALEIGMEWAKLTEKEKEERAKQQTTSQMKKEQLLAAKKRALAAYKEATRTPTPRQATTKPMKLNP